MKKIILIIGICALFAITPSISALSINEVIRYNNNEKLETMDNNAPYWADGTFAGKWGLREYNWLADVLDGENKSGMVQFELGNITGYYGKILFGSIFVFKGVFYAYNNESRKSEITGVSIGRVLGGRIGDVEIDIDNYETELNEADYAGLGGYNDTSFDWRIMLRKGPTLYMHGTYSKF